MTGAGEGHSFSACVYVDVEIETRTVWPACASSVPTWLFPWYAQKHWWCVSRCHWLCCSELEQRTAHSVRQSCVGYNKARKTNKNSPPKNWKWPKFKSKCFSVSGCWQQSWTMYSWGEAVFPSPTNVVSMSGFEHLKRFVIATPEVALFAGVSVGTATSQSISSVPQCGRSPCVSTDLYRTSIYRSTSGGCNQKNNASFRPLAQCSLICLLNPFEQSKTGRHHSFKESVLCSQWGNNPSRMTTFQQQRKDTRHRHRHPCLHVLLDMFSKLLIRKDLSLFGRLTFTSLMNRSDDDLSAWDTMHLSSHRSKQAWCRALQHLFRILLTRSHQSNSPLQWQWCHLNLTDNWRNIQICRFSSRSVQE